MDGKTPEVRDLLNAAYDQGILATDGYNKLAYNEASLITNVFSFPRRYHTSFITNYLRIYERKKEKVAVHIRTCCEWKRNMYVFRCKWFESLRSSSGFECPRRSVKAKILFTFCVTAFVEINWYQWQNTCFFSLLTTYVRNDITAPRHKNRTTCCNTILSPYPFYWKQWRPTSGQRCNWNESWK